MPKLPPGGNKRKLPDNPTPELLKKMKMDSVAPLVPAEHTNGDALAKGKGRAATVEDVDDEDDVMDMSQDYSIDEDDEGRFFGGGLTSEQKEILNIFENASGEDPPDDVSCVSLPASCPSSYFHSRPRNFRLPGYGGFS